MRARLSASWRSRRRLMWWSDPCTAVASATNTRQSTAPPSSSQLTRSKPDQPLIADCGLRIRTRRVGTRRARWSSRFRNPQSALREERADREILVDAHDRLRQEWRHGEDLDRAAPVALRHRDRVGNDRAAEPGARHALDRAVGEERVDRAGVDLAG